mgnify:CR=1 FL=1
MLNFKKVLNFRFMSLTVITFFIFTNTLYSCPDSSLRPPIGEKSTYRDIIVVASEGKVSGVLASNHSTTNRRRFLVNVAIVRAGKVLLNSQAVAQGVSASAIQRDLDNLLQFPESVYNGAGPISLEEMTARIITELPNSPALVIGESHNVNEEFTAAAYIIKSIRAAQYPIGVFLEEAAWRPDSPATVIGIFDETIIQTTDAKGVPIKISGKELLKASKVARIITISIQVLIDPKLLLGRISGEIRKIGKQNGKEPLLVAYVGNAHAVSFVKDYRESKFSINEAKSVARTFEDIFREEDKSAIFVTMIAEDTFFGLIQNRFLRGIFRENKSADALLEKIKVFKNLWADKMASFYKPGNLSFFRIPDRQNTYFGIMSGNRNPELIMAFEAALGDREIREGCDSGIFVGIDNITPDSVHKDGKKIAAFYWVTFKRADGTYVKRCINRDTWSIVDIYKEMKLLETRSSI